MRGVMKGYEDEFNARKQNLKKQKELEDAEYRKQLVDVGALEKAEREKEQLKKKNLLREQLNDLDLLNKKKEYENQRKIDDEVNLLKNQKDPWGKQYKDDLEYLMSLKNGRHGDMTQKEWEAYNRKLHYMNDVKNIFIIILFFLFYRDMLMVN